MKKILNIIILFAAVVFCGCSDFDDSELRGRIDGYKNRIEALKAKAETLGKQLADLSYLTNGNVITTVSQDADGKYVVTYKDNKDVEHTVVLATMDDIVDVPIIGVKLDENGVYYWTKCIDGEITWLTDDDGEKFPVSGYTPTISVDADGCWTVDGVQILDASGNPIKATTDATSVFRSAELDGDGNFSLTLGDGSTITLRVFNSLNLKLDAMPVTTVADPSKSITVSYELSGEAKETAIVAVAKAEGLDAVIDRDAKTVTVSFDASFSRGTVIVMAYDLADNVIVKPLFYKAATLGTVAISTPDQLVAFAAAVNAGGEEAAAKAVLTQDIDMKDVAWTPIGNGAYTTANAMTGPAFQGTFDGQGHAVRNLKIVVPADAAAGSAWGLFGVLKGATVRNLTIGEGSSVVSTAAAMTAVGAVAGYAYEATIENCENRAAIDIQGGGDNVRESAGGIVGAICANENDSHILSCTNYGKITSKNSVNTKNGATGFSIGGIVGFADASTTTERYNNVVGCVNEGAIDAQATRTAGVVATMNKYTKLESCVNNAAVTCSDVTASNSRVAGIVSAMGGHTYLTSCVNNGTVAFAVAGDTTHGYAAGIAGQTNDNNTAIDGCENYGAVLSDIINAAANKYIGIVCANTNKKTIAIRNCKIGGRIGPFSDGQQGATEITEQNFEQYIYFTLTGGGVPTLENNSFSGGPAKPGIATVEDLTAFRDAVNAGESTAQWEDAGGVVSLLGDIDMKDVAGWTPIGNASYKWEKNLLTIEGNAFKGTFDGQGYALKNLKLAYGGSAVNTAYGLFGVLDGATVRNLTVGAALGDASALKVTASGGTAEVGVIAGVCRDANVSDCANYGEIVTDDANRGVFFGYSAYATNWINCIAGGKVGVYNGGTTVYDSYGENEQVRYLGVQKAADPINADNITYLIGSSSGGSGGDDDVEPTLRILFIGNSFTKDAVEHLPKMVSAADIPTLKMVHLYYGGRTIPEYADGYATKSDYTCYKYNPGTSLWLSYTGYNIQQIVKSDTWDIVCLQEHTGNSCGWIWSDTEKNAIQGLIADIRADQNGHTPKFVYIMSQAYFNMDKIGTAQRPYKNFTTQDEMFDVIVAQARKVLDQTDVEQIIPTGTVLQNLRTSPLNNDMDLTRDGYHMDYGLSRYAAACAVFESIISPSFDGKKLDGNSFRYNVSSTADGTYTTPVTDDNQPVALQAARYALATPFAVTDMSPGTQTPGNGIEDTDFENDSNKE